MENITPMLLQVATWSCLVGLIVFGLSMLYLGALAFWQGYANSENWRKIANDLEKECQCLHKQIDSLNKELYKPKGEKQSSQSITSNQRGGFTPS